MGQIQSQLGTHSAPTTNGTTIQPTTDRSKVQEGARVLGYHSALNRDRASIEHGKDPVGALRSRAQRNMSRGSSAEDSMSDNVTPSETLVVPGMQTPQTWI